MANRHTEETNRQGAQKNKRKIVGLVIGIVAVGVIFGTYIAKSLVIDDNQTAIPAMAQIQQDNIQQDKIQQEENKSPNEQGHDQTHPEDTAEEDNKEDTTSNSNNSTTNHPNSQDAPETNTQPTEDKAGEADLTTQNKDLTTQNKDLTTQNKDLTTQNKDLATNTQDNITENPPNTKDNTGDAGGTTPSQPSGAGSGSAENFRIVPLLE